MTLFAFVLVIANNNVTKKVKEKSMQDPYTYYIEYVTVEGHKYRATIYSR